MVWGIMPCCDLVYSQQKTTRPSLTLTVSLTRTLVKMGSYSDQSMTGSYGIRRDGFLKLSCNLWYLHVYPCEAYHGNLQVKFLREQNYYVTTFFKGFVTSSLTLTVMLLSCKDSLSVLNFPRFLHNSLRLYKGGVKEMARLQSVPQFLHNSLGLYKGGMKEMARLQAQLIFSWYH